MPILVLNQVFGAQSASNLDRALVEEGKSRVQREKQKRIRRGNDTIFQ